MILVSRAFSTITEESASEGEHADAGMLAEDVPMTFRELVDAMRDHSSVSCWPARGDTHEWLSTGYDTSDWQTGEQREESLHYSRANPARNAKYWRAAMRAAGFLK